MPAEKITHTTVVQLRIPVDVQERLRLRAIELRAQGAKAGLGHRVLQLMTTQNLVRIVLLEGTPGMARRSLADTVKALKRLGVPRGRPPATDGVDAADIEDLKRAEG